MDRETAKQEIRGRWRDIIIHFTGKAKKPSQGEETYICPFCKHGKGGDGLKDNPKSKDGNGLKCFGCGWTGDILDFIREKNNATFNEALQIAAEIIGITIDPYDGNSLDYRNLTLDDNRRPQKAAGGPKRADRRKDDKTPGENIKGQEKAMTDAEKVRRRDYIQGALNRIQDPKTELDVEAIAYIESRGIHVKTTVKHKDGKGEHSIYKNIGFDPVADPAKAPFVIGEQGKRIFPTMRLVFPCGMFDKSLGTYLHYVARSIEPNTPKRLRTMNPAGDEIHPYNIKCLYETPATPNAGAPTVFITEGVFDALSFIECGIDAIALNSKGNGEILIDQLKRRSSKTQYFIVCHDNDPDPDTAADTMRKAEKLKDDLQELGYTSIIYNVAGTYHDANDALVNDRDGFEARIWEAMETAFAAAEEKKKEDAEQSKDDQEEKAGDPLPGLLTREDAIEEFAKADDTYITIGRFPNFSKTAKIKKHSSVVLAADTGAGKSSLAINFLNDLNDEYPCMYINLEMDRLTVLRRLVAVNTGMELDRIEGYRNDERTASAVNIALGNITSRKPLQIIQGAQVNFMLENIKDIIEKSTAGRKETTIVFIDHGLLVDTKKNTAGRYDRFTRVSEGLQKMALEYNIILFVLLQQNRSGKAEEEKAPKNSSLKESGSWENDATHICFLWYDPAVKRKKLLITKNRNGEQGQFVLDYWKKTQTYNESAGQASKETLVKPNRISKRDKQREKLQQAFEGAQIMTNGHPTLKAMADYSDVTTATVKRWIKEYGGCTIDGEQVDPAGIDTEIEVTGFVKLTPADDLPAFGETKGTNQKVTAKF